MAHNFKYFSSSNGNIDNFIACKKILPNNYEYEVCSYKDESIDCFNQSQFNAVIRTTLLNKEEIKEWLEKFTKKSGVIFRVDRTQKPSLRTIFKVQYRCHHNTRPRKNSTPHAKHTRCNAKLTINVKNIKRPDLSKDKYLPKFPTVITLRHMHNHPIKESLKFSDPTPEVRKAFLELFQNGHNVSSSLSVYKADIMESYELSEYDKIVNDRSIIPNKRWVRYLYDKVFSKESFVKDTVSLLANFVEDYNDKCGEACAKIVEEKDQQFTCAIVSPFMKRVHQLSNAGEYIIVDSSDDINRCLCKVYVLLINTNVGGLPVGVLMISTALKHRGLEKALRSYVELLPLNCFGGKGTIDGPSFVISNIGGEEKTVFSKIFPKSVLVESVYHSVKANWNFLFNQKHELSSELVSRGYLLLKDLANSENLEELLNNYEKIKLQSLTKENSSFQQQVKYLYEHLKEWELYLRAAEHVKEIQTISNQVLRDEILTRTKAASPIQFLEFITTSSMEEFYLSKIESAVLDQENEWFLNEFKEVASKTDNQNLIVFDVDPSNSVFEVVNKQSSDKYLVDNLLGFCSCFLGRSGAKCSHQLAIRQAKDLPKFNFPLVNNNDEIKQFFHKVLIDRGRLADQFLNFNNGPNVLTSSVNQRAISNSCFSFLPCNDIIVNNGMIEKCQTNLQSVFEDIMHKLKSRNAGQFLPAINNFINSYKKLTDLEKIDALNNFANNRSNVESIVLFQYDPLS